MEASRPLYKLGLQICGVTMLAALALVTLAWVFLDGPSNAVPIIAAVLGVVGVFGIALLVIDFVKHGDVTK